ncbi:MAG TPA: pentapeptide repeat-containing protein [Stenomitos sp.]
MIVIYGCQQFYCKVNISELLKKYQAGERSFRDVQLSGVNLSGVKLPGIILTRANLSSSNLSDVSLMEATLFRADLNKAKLHAADLRKANLKGANLSDSDLTGANLLGANLEKANFKNATYDQHTLFDKEFNPNEKGLVFIEPISEVVNMTNPIANDSTSTSSFSELKLTFQTESGIVTADLAQILGILGSILLFLGAFAPVVTFPIIGSINFLKNGTGDGSILIALAIASVLLILKRMYQWVWLSGLGALAVISLNFIFLQIKLSEVQLRMQEELAGNPFKGIADLAVQSIRLEWGWAILLIGSGLIITAAYLKKATLTKQMFIGLGVIIAITLFLLSIRPSLENQSQLGRARGSEGKSMLGTLNRAQQAFRLENNHFSQSIDQLDAKIYGKYYQYNIIDIDAIKVITKATPIQNDLKSYIAGASQVNDNFSQIICESKDNGKNIQNPTLDGTTWTCGEDSLPTE